MPALDKKTLLAMTVLAEEAKPLNDDEWGSERNVTLENAFFSLVAVLVSDDEFERMTDATHKATSEERINYFMNCLFEPPYNAIKEGEDVPEGLFLSVSSGIEIYNPYASCCGRFPAEPSKEYPEFKVLLDSLKPKI